MHDTAHAFFTLISH